MTRKLVQRRSLIFILSFRYIFPKNSKRSVMSLFINHSLAEPDAKTLEGISAITYVASDFINTVHSTVNSMHSVNVQLMLLATCGVCGALNATRCSGCNIAKYCGRTCQKQDWKSSHKNICESLSLFSSTHQRQHFQHMYDSYASLCQRYGLEIPKPRVYAIHTDVNSNGKYGYMNV